MTQVAPIRVTLAERDLLVVARAVMGREPFAFVEGILRGRARVASLGPTAMGALRRTLATAAVWKLARGGGARVEPRFAAGELRRGRAWEITPDLSLAFGRFTFELLRWLVEQPLGASLGFRGGPRADAPAPLDAAPETAGDELVCEGLLRLVAGTPLEPEIVTQPGVRASAFAWLGHVDALAWATAPPRVPEGPTELAPPVEVTAARMSALVRAERAVVVDAMRDDLSRAWTNAAAMPAPSDRLPHALGAAHVAVARGHVLSAFVDAAREAGRLDLATFLVTAAARVVPAGASAAVTAEALTRGLAEGGPLRDRSRARRHACALLRVVATLDVDREQLAHVRFFDEGYELAQATLAAWDVLGKDGFARVREVVRELDAIDAGATRREESE